jgi:hypothetical protein
MNNHILLKDKNKPFRYNRIYCDIAVFDNDFMMTCPDRICVQCGNDHSFRGNFKGVLTSIDVIPSIFSKELDRNIKSEVL